MSANRERRDKEHKENESPDPVELQEEKEKEKKELTPFDLNYPLLREFRERAPGSFKHTQALVAMVQNVCAAIDIDPNDMYLAAQYHDIGKMWFPDYYTENQAENNIHDQLDPFMSYVIITQHVSNSVLILFQSDFPRKVIEIISQHHGTNILQSIFEKVKDPEKADLFRYKTAKPASFEALILMMCDNAEATSRSIYINQQKRVEPATLVMNIFNRLQMDGQFDNVSVLLGKLKKMQDAIIADVASTFQKRVAYQGDDDLVKSNK